MELYQLKDSEDWECGILETGIEESVIQSEWSKYYGNTEEVIVQDFIDILENLYPEAIITRKYISIIEP